MSASRIAVFTTQFLEKHPAGRAEFYFDTHDGEGPAICEARADTFLMPIGEQFLLFKAPKDAPGVIGAPIQLWNVNDLLHAEFFTEDQEAVPAPEASSQQATTAPARG